MQMEADVGKEGDVVGDGFRDQAFQNRHRPVRHKESGEATGKGKQKSLGDELAAQIEHLWRQGLRGLRFRDDAILSEREEGWRH